MLQIGEFNMYQLNGGITKMDGGAMFGAVPKPLWSKKYPSNDNNQIPLLCYPILIRNDEHNILIDAGIGNDKLNDKQRRNFGVDYESYIEIALKEFNLSVGDIDIILMSHMHFDHACGLTTSNGESVFKEADIYVSQIEWNELRAPNIRSQATYWKKNYQGIEKQIISFKQEMEVIPGIKMIHTGGHSAGHAIIEIESNGEKAIHMADIFPTVAHANPLWITAYDDYPMTTINEKERLIQRYIKEERWFTYYHDSRYFAVKFDKEKHNIISDIKRGEINEV